jgi:quercetin dioxygenase-like cupin family protein
MYVVNETEKRTVRTAAATMYALAGPSQGSAEVSTWRVHIDADAATPVHVIDREQVWMPIAGVFEVTVDDSTEKLATGQSAIIPGRAVRQVRASGGPAEALVAMVVGGKAMMPGKADKIPLPWAE